MFFVKTPRGSPADVADVQPEIIAGQRVGTRLQFRARHDLTVEFAGGGACMIDDIDLIVFIVPNEFFCYRDGDFVMKFVMDCRRLVVDRRPAIGRVNARAFLSAES